MTALELIMVKVYANLVRAGVRTLDSVPTNLQTAVQTELAA